MDRGFVLACVAACTLQAAPAASQLRPAVPVLTRNAELRGALQRVSRKSALWRGALETIARLGRTVLVVTPDEVVLDAAGSPDAFDPTSLAEASPVLLPDSSVHSVVVIVNVELLRRAHRQAGTPESSFEADLARVLVHEVYGHAVPYLLAGNLSGRCPDPGPGERAWEACSIRRENAVREETGLGRRRSYGLGGLAIGWYVPDTPGTR